MTIPLAQVKYLQAEPVQAPAEPVQAQAEPAQAMIIHIEFMVFSSEIRRVFLWIKTPLKKFSLWI
jgi:hypothetical protein